MAFDLNNIKIDKKTEAPKENILTKDFQLFGNKFSDKNKEHFYSSISTLLSSGLDLYRALEIVLEETDNKSKSKIIAKLLEHIQKGKTLSEAMQMDDYKVFTSYEISSIKIGEEVGKLHLVLDELKRFYEANLKRKRLLTNALTYPILVILIALVAVFFMMVFVVPMFQDVFRRFNGELPAITQTVISISNIFTKHIGTFMLIVIGLIFSIRYLIKIPSVQLFLSNVLLKIPFIGSYVVTNQLAKITGMLSMMLASGVHLIRALELTSDAISFLPYKNSLRKIREDIEQGSDMHRLLANKILYPSKFRSLVKIGEEVNKLDYFFTKMNREYNVEIEQSTSILGTILEPILLVFLGGLIGFILVAMYLPLFDLSSQW
jgi:type IV pilus assembly protein PilC